MITITDCGFSNCGTGIKISGDVTLNVDGLDVDNCGAVFDIDSKYQVNAHVNNVNVSNTDTYLMVDGEAKASSKSMANARTKSKNIYPVYSSSNEMIAYMRIAKGYLASSS